MASPTALYQIHSLFLYKTNHPQLSLSQTRQFRSNFFFQRKLSFEVPRMPRKETVVVSATTAEKKRHPGEAKGFVEEMRFVAMRLHTKDQAKEGEKEVEKPEERSVTKWEPTVDGYLRFLVDSKLVYDTLEKIVQDAAYPYYAEFKNTGLERTASLDKDLEWFKEQGYTIPEPSSPGLTYTQYLTDLSHSDPQAFICHFYNIYFAHSAGGRPVMYNIAMELLRSTANLVDSQQAISASYKVQPKKKLLTAFSNPSMEKSFLVRKDLSRDGEIITGFYSKQQLACFFTDRKRIVQELKEQMQELLDAFYEKTNP